MLVFFNRLPDPALSEFDSRMIGDDWFDFSGFSNNGKPSSQRVKRFRFNSLGRLHRALELLCVGLGTDELGLIRASIVREGVPEHEVIVEAAQGMEYLGELLKRVRASWLDALLTRKDQFFNVFQPLVSMKNGSVFAYEMLIRAHAAARGGVIGGAQLAEAALASNQIYEFDFLAREVAIQTAADRFHKNTKVFINFMPNAVFESAQTLDKTTNQCMQLGLDPSRVVFEVIESESVADIGYLKDLLNNYRKLGYNIALDDLGSGYSGLNYMLELMPDFVKLDRELVDGVENNKPKRVIISKLTEAAHDLGITVIAEGIERAGDFTVVRDLGVDIVQGYFLAKPSADVIFEENFNLVERALNGSAAKNGGSTTTVRSAPQIQPFKETNGAAVTVPVSLEPEPVKKPKTAPKRVAP